ncbi:hypothetical protein CB0940_04732 [Cercospora beticola]|uniref:Uncharacterized protein n=1 Tax=Cercospora beticola TaxID=122368 RepID=A0A2G5HL91_CERBT|nr:hypothetical protein CB0940_04732 [Cercospora beticola]PIA93298.1 hypothetical protein CB0940_04732 [Cercospora beticola]WPB01996.1 hypothetical protein RHO25_006630 [Cercospora beticola]CAK1363155.1 unnamed protein product [Cercospora beticola]
MPEKLKGPFSFKVAKAVLSPSDMERLACAFLNTENVYQFDLNKAASDFGGAKPDSFKRSIWVITKKIKEAMEGQGSDAGGDEVAATPAKSAGKKRKGAASEVNGDESAVKKKAKVNGARGKAKKAKTEVENGEDDGEDPLAGAADTPVKKEKHVAGEGGDGDDGDDWLV